MRFSLMYQHFASLGENGKTNLGIPVSLFIFGECKKYLYDHNLYVSFGKRWDIYIYIYIYIYPIRNSRNQYIPVETSFT